MNQEKIKEIVKWCRREYRMNRMVGFKFSRLEHDRTIIWAMEKQIKVEPIPNFETGGSSLAFDCPKCRAFASAGMDYYGPDHHFYKQNNCSNCGQAIDWEGIE